MFAFSLLLCYDLINLILIAFLMKRNEDSFLAFTGILSDI